MVGSVLMERMRQENDFQGYEVFFFSTSQAGQQGPEISGTIYELLDANDTSLLGDMDIILSCQGGGYTSSVYPALRNNGWQGYWIDAASTLRMEEDAIIMHGEMMSSQPPLYYWSPVTMALILAAAEWRAAGLPVYFTIDAGPNVHFICEAEHAANAAAQIRKIPGVQDVIISGPGGPARLID